MPDGTTAPEMSRQEQPKSTFDQMRNFGAVTQNDLTRIGAEVRMQADLPKPVFGPGSKEEEMLKAVNEISGMNSAIYRITENLKWKSFLEMELREKLQIKEAVRSSITEAHITLERRMSDAIESFDYNTLHYTVQGEKERIGNQIVMYEDMLDGVAEGLPANERFLGLVSTELHREKSAVKIFEKALPYKAAYYGGIDPSLGLLGQRSGQFYLGDMSNVLQGVDAKWVDEKPKELSLKEYPETEVIKRQKEINEWEEIRKELPQQKEGETMSDRYARYVGDTDFFLRAVGEMNTYNPTNKGEELNLTETMQQFLGDMLQKRPRTLEDGSIEENIKDPTRKITVYLDKNGNQIPVDDDGKPTTTPVETKTAHIENIDYYNKSRSNDEIKWVICVTSAMAMCDAKQILDSLPYDMSSVTTINNNPDASKYNQLWGNVQSTAQRMMENFTIPSKKDFDFRLAKSAFYLSDAIAFGTFDVGKRGFNYEWKQVEKDGGLVWEVEPTQGDPTASGDSFTGAKRYFHEVVYQGLKSRVSAFGQGVLPPVDPAQAKELANVYVSEAAEANDRARIIEKIKSGKQQHLATYFGIIGAFKDELGKLPAWQKGEQQRLKQGKQVNPNFSKTVEATVVFVPTPFNFKNVDLNSGKNKLLSEYVKEIGADDGENLIFPIISPQHKIDLYSMLSVSKKYTVADLLDKCWTKDEQGILHETAPKDGGRRLTLRDIKWNEHSRYADNGRAVNNNFMLQVFSPVYGEANQKDIEAAAQNPMAVMTRKIKAVDIMARNEIKKVDPSGDTAKRQSFEIAHSTQILFQQLALGVHGLIGRDATERYLAFVADASPAKKKELRMSDNLYTTLRAAEDLLSNKQGYDHYSDSFFCSFMAMAEALKPITFASNEMANATTMRFKDKKPTQIDKIKAFVTEEDKNA